MADSRARLLLTAAVGSARITSSLCATRGSWLSHSGGPAARVPRQRAGPPWPWTHGSSATQTIASPGAGANATVAEKAARHHSHRWAAARDWIDARHLLLASWIPPMRTRWRRRRQHRWRS
jgi:hypothetical protein